MVRSASWRCRRLCGGAGELRLYAQAIRHRRRVQLSGQRRELFRRQSSEKRLQQNFGFAQASVEVIVNLIEHLPRAAGLHGDTPRDVAGRLAEFAVKLFECSGKNAQLVEEARSIVEQHVVKNSVPRGGALRRVAAEESRVQWFDDGQMGDLAAAGSDRAAKRDEGRGQPLEQVCRDRNLLPGAHELPAGAQRECVVERHAHHGVRAFPPMNDGLEDLSLLPRQSRNPVLGHAPARGGRKFAEPKEHPCP